MAWQSFGKTTDMGLPTHKARFTPLEYQFAKEFYQERTTVKKHDKWGMIDQTSKAVIPIIYDHVDVRF
ncbi:MAG: hypothetical protein Q4A69_01985 [Moraxella sp.]|nr:hypothetical protein [Moraxella sp.]